MRCNNSSAVLADEKKIIQFVTVEKSQNKKSVKYNNDGSIKRTRCNKVAGESSEVFAFRTKEEITAMIKVFDTHIKFAPDADKRQIACRNKLLFLIGINIGIRASDLRTLKWSFFLNEDRTFKERYILQPKKQSSQKKFVKLFFNQTVKKAVADYISKYPVKELDTYVFSSRKGDSPIAVQSLWRIIKEAAIEAGIEQNIGSHSLRKSWGFWCWHNAEDKRKALVMLQKCFNHSSNDVTMRYIGIMDDEIADMYYSVELGLDDLDEK